MIDILSLMWFHGNPQKIFNCIPPPSFNTSRTVQDVACSGSN